MKYRKYFIVNIENKKDKNIQSIFISEKLISFEDKVLFNPNIDTAPKVGRDNRNDILRSQTY